MDQIQSFEEFLATQSVQVPAWSFALNLLIAAALAYLLGRIYIRFGTSLSNRSMFAGTFMLLAMTTMLIISVVKSSIALSLGLVGALSIVRFRAAIKEPEELAYLFLTIGIGLGLGADQRLVTLIAFALIVGVIMIRHRTHTREESENLYLTVGSSGDHKLALGSIVEVLKKHCDAVDLKRFDDTGDRMEASFLVSFSDFAALEASRTELSRLHEGVTLAFLDNQGIGGPM